MKIYTVVLDLTLVLDKLKSFDLKEFDSKTPTIFVESENPDEACYNAYCRLSELLLKQSASTATAKLINEIENDIKVIRVFCK